MTSPRTAKKGYHIALEGVDGSGTTTQRDRLVVHLRNEGHKVVSTEEPQRSRPIGQLIRKILTRESEACHDIETMSLLFAADRRDHYKSVIEPAVKDGKIVVSDRAVWSSIGYQSLSDPLATQTS
jgi:dTMP kinase